MTWIYNVILLLIFTFRRGFRSFTTRKIDFSKILKRKEGETRIWIHASSLGEVKTSAPLIEAIKKDLPQATILLSTGSATGYKEALSNGGRIDFCFRIPLDLSWCMKKVVRLISPDLFILIESDFWMNLFSALKKQSIPIVLVNGRISKKSTSLFKKIPILANRIFSSIDLCCLQEEEYIEAFKSLNVPSEKIYVTGNLKYDVKKSLDFDLTLQFPKEKRLVVIASTHNKEEELILNSLKEIDESICFLLAPRHPERFSVVKNYLKREKISYRTISEEKSKNDRIVLVDKIGVLDQCFKVSDIAIIGGSFIKDVGGHNVYEPTRFGIPVLYGPYMHKQKGIVKALKKYNIGAQVELVNLKSVLESFLDNQNFKDSYQNLRSEMEGAATRSWEKIKSI